jgi:hypothetical protein
VNKQIVRTDHVLRYHLYIDTEAVVFDAFVVDLFPFGPVVLHREGVPLDDLWREVPAAIQRLREQPAELPHPPSVFVPFACITAVEHARMAKEQELRTLSIVGGVDEQGHPDHAERVRALCRMADLLDMCGPLEPRQVGQWPPVRHH